MCKNAPSFTSSNHVCSELSGRCETRVNKPLIGGGGGGEFFSILFAAESCTKYIESVDQILFHLHVMLQISNYNMLLYYEQDNVYFTKLMLQEETFATTMRTGEKQTTK